ncbi:MAG: UDP-N-acetylmuramate:L-alanyl-gamma-D-glutamyl-meso-diaminopimelate ligase [Candidatus Manganitrophus sp. SB1]|nr:UDP-N-acetylmuramate:L-alanyl-gamma-D-glutamyl-meso-diaminopimelate ligase [Candidatus Manganitrophus morganii]
MPESKRIHIIAVCGTGMAALAGLLKKGGHAVTGSDTQIYPPMSTLLEEAGIPCKIGYDPSHIEPNTDLVIIGNAVGKTNPEVVATLERGLPYFSMPAALGEFFLKGKTSLVVAGTHGKTTTSSLLAWVLTSAGLDPGMMIGGWVKNFNSNHRSGKGNYFVVEGDEYDTAFFDKGPKFLHYQPHHAILTSIEFDHGDIYADLAAIKQSFRKFVALLPAEGLLVTAAGDPAIGEVIKGAGCRIETYGIDEEADWQAEQIHMTGELLSFDVFRRRKKMGTIRNPLAGRHNLKNTLAVIALAHEVGVPWEKIAEGVLRFEGIKRRQEIVGEVRDILIIDDFAHHPTAISETLMALRLRYPTRRLWAVFEPRSATSRRNVFQKEFVAALAPADRIILADIFAPEKIPAEDRLNPEKIISDLVALGKNARFLSTADRIVSEMVKELVPGDVVCVMSSGGFGGIHQKLISKLAM